MKSHDDELRAWREAPPEPGATEAEIGAVVRAMAAPAAPDDLRLAQLRQKILRARPARVSFDRFSFDWLYLGRLRAGAFAAVCVLAGGVATAAVGLVIVPRLGAHSGAGAGARAGERPTAMDARHGGRRKWRLAVRGPAELEVSVDDRGAEIGVVDGHATLSGATLGAAVGLGSGEAWHEPAGDREPTGAERPLAPPPPPAANLATPAPRPAADLAPNTGRPTTSPALDEVSARRPEPTTAVAAPAPLAPEERTEIPAPPVQPPPFGDLATSAAPASDVPGEGSALADALHALRADADPRGALERLDDYDRRFPRGPLRREATLARVEAQLTLGRRAAALELLDGLPLTRDAADGRAVLVRGELRAAANRWLDAVADFSGVLAGRADDDAAARALYGRGACELRLGDAADARDDFATYVRRFPDGTRRAEIDRALAHLPP